MEILSCHSGLCCYDVNFFSRETSDRSLSSTYPRHYSILQQKSLCCIVFKPSHLRSSPLDHFRSNKFCTIGGFKGLRNSGSSLVGGTYNSYILDREEGARSITDTGKVPKILIPGLPDESKGEYAAPISSCFWEWKPKLNVHYEKSGSENVNSPPILFLPGFGVGSFHYEKQLKDLGREFRAWALDFLGQGMSMPSEDPTLQSGVIDKSKSAGEDLVWGFGDEAQPWAKELVYSMDLWRDQVHSFIEEVIKEPVYIVGNSLGGYVALYIAASNPHLVKGVTLLNATPFWGFLPNPIKSPRLSRMFPMPGTFPIPAPVRKMTELVWQKISDPDSITEVLKQVYADHSTNVDGVFFRILETTKHPAAAAVFTSIMFAPQSQLSFDEALSGCRANNIPICLVYGKDDPWVKPIWGAQVKRRLPEAPYYEISPAGHCPHDEVPEVVNFLLRGWITSLESKGSVALPLLDSPESAALDFFKELEFVREGLRKPVNVQFYGSNFSFWKRFGSYLNLPFQGNDRPKIWKQEEI
ncbi:pheophytinase, chloroplastic-like [Ipomoea triloba]|uniref:pheophytinase, chloroplastic-like n=1 Tax=Ipomoea triloba TaxID=35885 RepID=UPI00125D055A|nr:pheophytinase, chloroplastic-like [Ipomoea triloba]